MKQPPFYIEQHVTAPHSAGPSRLLADGAWCGHGEPDFAIYDIHDNGEAALRLLLPRDPYPALCAVSAVGSSGDPFFIYDSRHHPASLYCDSRREFPYHTVEHTCENCGGRLFRLSVGFEIPGDSESPVDTSWFALAAECAGCCQQAIVFDDETA